MSPRSPEKVDWISASKETMMSVIVIMTRTRSQMTAPAPNKTTKLEQELELEQGEQEEEGDGPGGSLQLLSGSTLPTGVGRSCPLKRSQ